MHRSLTSVGTILLIIAVMAVTIPLPAQTATGDIAGIVTDVQGAVVIGARVTAEETSTHRLRTTVTNDQGVFSFPLLPPDTYRITAVTRQMAESGTQIELRGGHSPSDQLRPVSSVRIHHAARHRKFTLNRKHFF